MRLTHRPLSILAISAAIACAACAPVWAQDDAQILMPEQSAAKAKQLLQQTIQALGGNAYLDVKDSSCMGWLGEFGHSGALQSYDRFWDFVKFPDKDRTEFSKKRNIIQIFNGNQGWVLDRGGVSDADASQIKDNENQLEMDLDNILRFRMKDPGMIFRYDGPDVVDLKEADWVELDDPQGHEIRIAIGRLDHLPIRKEVAMRDPITHMRTEEVDYYSNFHPIDGVMMYFDQTHVRNGLKTFTVSYIPDGCKFNTGLQDAFFTKASLDERWAKVGKKGKKDKTKEKDASGP
ncbi:MAG: hypothetical protein WBE20_15715 [Candidatus Acidiferrales bacterium]